MHRPTRRAGIRLASGAAGAVLGLGVALCGPASAQAHQPSGLGQHVAVPAYIPPSDTTSWTELSGAGPALGIVVANPASGPGAAVDPAWQTVIQATSQAGTKVLGYVDTGYFGFTGRRTASGSTDPTAWLVQAELDIDRWYDFYGDSLDGIFFDEVENVCGPDRHSSRYVDLYRELNAFTHDAHHGSLTVANPGTSVPDCYRDAADILVTFEGSATDYLDPPSELAPRPWQLAADPDKFWNIVYDVPQADLADVMAASKHDNAGYIYATPRTLGSNPYLAAPDAGYFAAELAAAPASGGQPAPWRPTRPRAVHRTSTSITLQWRSVDSWRVVGYDVFADGAWIGSTGATGRRPARFTASGLSPATRYTFTVRARNRAGTQSAPTRPVSYPTRHAGRIAPTAPSPLVSTDLTPASVTLDWPRATARHSDISRYEVYRDGRRILILDAATTEVTIADLMPERTYTFTVAARDRTGRVSPMSNPVTVTTPAPEGGGVTGPVVVLTADTVTFQAVYNLPYTFRNVFVDTDLDPTTGYAVTVDGGQIGADFLIENGTFYSYTGPGFAWNPIAGVAPLVSDVDGLVTWRVPAGALGPAVTSVAVVFNGSGGFPDAYTGVVTATRP